MFCARVPLQARRGLRGDRDAAVSGFRRRAGTPGATEQSPLVNRLVQRAATQFQTTPSAPSPESHASEHWHAHIETSVDGGPHALRPAAAHAWLAAVRAGMIICEGLRPRKRIYNVRYSETENYEFERKPALSQYTWYGR